MKRNKIEKTGCFLLIVISLLLNSCSDCWYDYECIVNNNTNSDLRIYCKSAEAVYPKVNKTIILPPNSSEVIIAYGELDGCTGCKYKKDCGPYKEFGSCLIDSISIIMNDTMQTKLNYSDYQKWNFSLKDEKGTFTITLSDSDFERK